MGLKHAVMMDDQTFETVASLAAIPITVADAVSALKFADRAFYNHL